MNRISFLMMLFSITAISCSDDLLDFELSEKEIRIISDCKSDPITSMAELESNLIGTWDLYGVSCTHISCHPGREWESNISLILRSDKTGTSTEGSVSKELTWKVIENTDGKLNLEVDSKIWSHNNLSIFCTDFMIRENSTETAIHRKKT